MFINFQLLINKHKCLLDIEANDFKLKEIQ